MPWKDPIGMDFELFYPLVMSAAQRSALMIFDLRINRKSLRFVQLLFELITQTSALPRFSADFNGKDSHGARIYRLPEGRNLIIEGYLGKFLCLWEIRRSDGAMTSIRFVLSREKGHFWP
jgi:hypothetical protein